MMPKFTKGNTAASMPMGLRQGLGTVKGKAGRTAQTISLEGPFFEGDPAKTLAENIRDFLAKTAEEGEHDVKTQIQSVAGQMPHYTGWTTATVTGRVVSLKGKQWRKTAVVSTSTAGMSAKDAIRTKAAGSTIERRWHVFRRSSTRLKKANRNPSTLLKGIA